MLYISDIAGAIGSPGGGGLPSSDNALAKLVTLDQVTGPVTLDFKTAYAYRIVQGEGDLTLEANITDPAQVAHGLIIFEKHPDYALSLGSSFKINPVQEYTLTPNSGIYAVMITNETLSKTLDELNIQTTTKYLGSYTLSSVTDNGRFVLSSATINNSYVMLSVDMINNTYETVYVVGNIIQTNSWGGNVIISKDSNAAGNQNTYKYQRQGDNTFTSEVLATHYVRHSNNYNNLVYHPADGGVIEYATSNNYRSMFIRSDGTKVALPFSFPSGAGAQFNQDATLLRLGDRIYRTKYPQDLYPHRVINGNSLGTCRFTPDGSRLLINEGGDSRIYTTSTPFGLLDLTLVSEAVGQGIRSFDISPDGTRMVYAVYNTNTVSEAILSTPWDLLSATDTSATYTTTTNTLSVQYVDGGQQIYYGGYGGTVVYSIPLSVAYDLSTTGAEVSKSVINNVRDLGVSGDGTRAFTTVGMGLHTYEMTTPWDLSTLTLLFSNDLGMSGVGTFFVPDADYYDYMDPDYVSFCRRGMNLDGTKAYIGCRCSYLEFLIVEVPLLPNGALDVGFGDFSTYFEEVATLGFKADYGLSGDFKKLVHMPDQSTYYGSGRATIETTLVDRCLRVTQLGTDVMLTDLETDSLSL
jgi:hypothetical protein